MQDSTKSYLKFAGIWLVSTALFATVTFLSFKMLIIPDHNFLLKVLGWMIVFFIVDVFKWMRGVGEEVLKIAKEKRLEEKPIQEFRFFKVKEYKEWKAKGLKNYRIRAVCSWCASYVDERNTSDGENFICPACLIDKINKEIKELDSKEKYIGDLKLSKVEVSKEEKKSKFNVGMLFKLK